MNVTKKNVVVFDLDNCLAEDGSRLHLIPGADKHGHISEIEAITGRFAMSEQRRWDAYHKAGEGASAHNHETFFAAAEALPKHNGIVIFLTARPESHAAQTSHWLERNGFASVPRWALLMRRDVCLAPSPVMKPLRLSEWLADHGMSFDNVACVYDDRNDVLDAFRACGIATTKLAIEER